MPHLERSLARNRSARRARAAGRLWRRSDLSGQPRLVRHDVTGLHLVLVVVLGEGGFESEDLPGARIENQHLPAPAFCDAIGWLTAALREDIERRYIQDQTAITRDSLQHVAGRVHELRTEYQQRYDTLRARLLAGWLLGSIPVLTLAWVVSAR
ncbi:hypothetical protein [Actinacidiphila oryziradicis]|uniref:hypothetical protein n=1 Tax=Actinacidiphila oryziradicis TaxID=2571141 RepID=UPI00145F875D|nr:hypothetical protein [Actinacidiphila oryziradicis]